VSRILLLEDDSLLHETIVEYLEELEHEVYGAYDSNMAEDALFERRFDLLILDVNVPGVDGFELLKAAREQGVEAPAIFITSLDGVDDIERGFDVGCDDYLKKPFELGELRVRINRLLKQSYCRQQEERIDLGDGVVYEISSQTLTIDAKPVPIGNKEHRLLKLFLKHRNEVIVHERFFVHLWDYDETPSDTSLRTYIKNLRKLIGKEKIVSIKKQGYKLAV